MNDKDKRLLDLEAKLRDLEQREDQIQQLKSEIWRLKADYLVDQQQQADTAKSDDLDNLDVSKSSGELVSDKVTEDITPMEKVTANLTTPKKEQPRATPPPLRKPLQATSKTNNTIPNKKSDLEKFIGENLISKIGIAITIIGVGIGAKYSIENDLISPMLRIILGYILGIGLLGFGIKLKKKYHNYSAVLVSGAMAIMYLMTFLGYVMYDLYSVGLTFSLMVLFTGFTVFASIKYDKQIIAILGLAGAYAIPFMLTTGNNNYLFFLTYMCVVNVGILIVSLIKYWKPLYYTSFFFTWLIFFNWAFNLDTDFETHFGLATTFLFVFYLTFYGVFIGYKLLKKRQMEEVDIVLWLFNNGFFYGLGCFMLTNISNGSQWLGLFTIINGLIHLGIAVLIVKRKLQIKNLFYLMVGLVVLFATIAMPIQLMVIQLL